MICCGGVAISATPSSTRRTPLFSRPSGARSGCGSQARLRLIACEDAGLFRDALGVMPPGGLPEAFLEAVPDALGTLLARFARSRGPFTTAEVAARYGLDEALVESVLGEPRARRPARPGRASARWSRARVVRSGCAQAVAASVARGTAQGGRARRAVGVRALPAGLARNRPACKPSRGARPAAVTPLAGLAVGERGAATPRTGLPAGLARRALRHRGDRLGRRRPRSRCAVLPRGCAAPRRAGRCAGARG